ncbi:DUF6265 family protein [Phenylobacterium sp. J426]|uniref:DUF6265 family protein n=1 Tax=Phenylobacterium sp. J426 TaxID=2898439 RepID=UPI0021519F65|nr:DUF6265 family protein [Phenylobacterium sp. J426]MCR5874302.1 DUF6265 family protein [Phenylobacterium sp. J426]
MILAMLAAGAVAVDVASLDWLAGAWTQDRDGGVVQETWLQPRDGVMAGVSQTNRPGRKPFVEHMTISAEPAGLTFTALIQGQPPTAFVLLPGKNDELVFENPAHDFPQRVFYRRCGEDLCAGIEGRVKGEVRRQEWRYTRVR